MTVGSSCRTLLGGLLTGLDDYVAFILQQPHTSRISPQRILSIRPAVERVRVHHSIDRLRAG